MLRERFADIYLASNEESSSKIIYISRQGDCYCIDALVINGWYFRSSMHRSVANEHLLLDALYKSFGSQNILVCMPFSASVALSSSNDNTLSFVDRFLVMLPWMWLAFSSKFVFFDLQKS
jgi:hypothetical protein